MPQRVARVSWRLLLLGVLFWSRRRPRRASRPSPDSQPRPLRGGGGGRAPGHREGAARRGAPSSIETAFPWRSPSTPTISTSTARPGRTRSWRAKAPRPSRRCSNRAPEEIRSALGPETEGDYLLAAGWTTTLGQKIVSPGSAGGQGEPDPQALLSRGRPGLGAAGLPGTRQGRAGRAGGRPPAGAGRRPRHALLRARQPGQPHPLRLPAAGRSRSPAPT